MINIITVNYTVIIVYLSCIVLEHTHTHTLTHTHIYIYTHICL